MDFYIKNRFSHVKKYRINSKTAPQYPVLLFIPYSFISKI